MNKSLKRVMTIGLISHALAFSTLYVILSAMMTNGSIFVPAFLGSALLMAVAAHFTLRDPDIDRRQRFFVFGFGTLGLGVGGLLLIDASEMIEPMLLLLLIGLFMWRRMLYMAQNVTYLRRALLDHYRTDLSLLAAAVVAMLFLGRDPGWETRMLPFFIAFMITRMLALSLASKLNNSGKSPSKGVVLSNNMPFLFVGGVVLLSWMISVSGGPITRWFVGILTPIFYAVGHVVEWLSMLFGDTIRKGFRILSKSKNKKEPPPEPEGYGPYAGEHWITDVFLYVFVGVVIAIIAWYFYRQMRQMSRVQLDGGILEVREFIQEETKHKPKPRTTFTGPLTPMRKTYRRFLLAMKKSGHLRTEGETASEYIKKVASQHPEWSSSMEELTDYYMQERYGKHSVDDKQQRADTLTNELSKDKNRDKK